MCHSNSIISALSSSWTSKPPLAIRYKSDIDVSNVYSDGKSHCSTLEQLLAWEKKLYEEIKVKFPSLISDSVFSFLLIMIYDYMDGVRAAVRPLNPYNMNNPSTTILTVVQCKLFILL